MKDLQALKQSALQHKEVKKHYDKLSARYEIISQLISVRTTKKVTQKELAKKMGTTQSSIARFEAGNVNPSLDFLEKLTAVLNCKLVIKIL